LALDTPPGAYIAERSLSLICQKEPKTPNKLINLTRANSPRRLSARYTDTAQETINRFLTSCKGAVFMSITVEYITYNNKDFKQIIPCDDMEDAEMLKAQLEKLRHVSGVRITTSST